MRDDLGRWRHRVVAIENDIVILAISAGSRPARDIRAMGYEVVSAGAGQIAVSVPRR
jgi:hypothetical protein